MNKILKKCDLYILLLILITIVGTYFFSNYIFTIIGDVGREIYYPKLVLDNQVLFKDIFNIFGPFSYLFNALLYKIFGVKLSVLIIAGYFSALLTVLGTYMLAKQFLDKNTSFIISSVVAIAGVYNIHDFRYIFCPYAYAIVYGLIAFIWGLYFFDKYFQTNKNKYIYITAFLTGIACCSKYEYILFALFLFVFFIFYKKDSKIKTLTLCSLCFLTPILICFSYLAYKGLTVNDFINALVLIKKLVATNAYQYFYSNCVGTFISENIFKILVMASEKFIVFYVLFYLACKLFRKQKLLGLILFSLPLLYFIYLIYMAYPYDNFLCYVIILCLILFIMQYKTLSVREKFIVISALLVSLKIFWNCNIKYYGVYFIPVLFIILFILLKKYPQLNITFKVYIVLVLLVLLSSNIMERRTYNIGVPVQNITLYIPNSSAYKINRTVKYIKKHTRKNDTVVIYPDGLFINYVTGRPSIKKYDSAQAPYMEIFNEKKYIKHLKKNKPEVFILTNRSQNIYNQTKMCDSFGNNLCNFIKKNYKEDKIYKYSDNDNEPFLIYKRIY
jgi:hypothetical protein